VRRIRCITEEKRSFSIKCSEGGGRSFHEEGGVFKHSINLEGREGHFIEKLGADSYRRGEGVYKSEKAERINNTSL